MIELIEHTELSSNLGDDELRAEADGLYRRRVNGVPQPVMFTLIAER